MWGFLRRLAENGCQAAIGIPEDQNRIGFDFRQNIIHPADDQADGLRSVLTSRIQKKVRFTDLKIIKKDLVQLIIIILTSVNQSRARHSGRALP